MSFYNAHPMKATQADDDWACPNCENRNKNSVAVCAYCFEPRRDENTKQCCCFEFTGDNAGCPVHGVMEKEKA